MPILVVRTPVSSLGSRYVRAPKQATESEERGSVSRSKTPSEQGLPRYTCCMQSNAFLICDGREGEAQIPDGTCIHCEHHPVWNPQCTQKSRKLLCPKPKIMLRFSLGDVGEARWLLSYRWTETSPISPDVALHSRNQRRVASLTALSLLSVCVRLRQLREVHHNLQRTLTPQPLTDAQRSNQRCTSHL